MSGLHADKRGSYAVVLLSGGLDSVAALHWAINTYPEVRAIGFSYGQPNRDCELVAAQHIVDGLGCGLKLTGIHLGDAMRPEKPIGLLHGVTDHDPAHQGLHPAFTPGRNLVFLSIAAAHACCWFPKGNVDLIIGANKHDAEGFPDCRVSVLARMGEVLRHGCARQIGIVAPFLDRTKAQIIEMVRPFPGALASIACSWSCYRAIDKKPCGKCTPCVLRAEAFDAAGLLDACAVPKMTGGDPQREVR